MLELLRCGDAHSLRSVKKASSIEAGSNVLSFADGSVDFRPSLRKLSNEPCRDRIAAMLRSALDSTAPHVFVCPLLLASGSLSTSPSAPHERCLRKARRSRLLVLLYMELPVTVRCVPESQRPRVSYASSGFGLNP